MQLASTVKAYKGSVYIRFGYEFDGYYQAYQPEKYIDTYTKFVDKMRFYDITNVAYVWHSCGVPPYYGSKDFPEEYSTLKNGKVATFAMWYPRDQY